jgi:hypothetical protein
MFTFYATNKDALANLKEVQAFNAKMDEKLANARAKKDKEEAESADKLKKQAEELKKQKEADQKDASQRVTQTGLAVASAGTDEAKLAEVNAEIKRLNIADDQLTLMKKLEDAQQGRIKLTDLELQKLQTYIGYLGQRKSLEDSIAAEDERVKAEAAAEDLKEQRRRERLAEMTQSVRAKGEEVGFGRKTEDEQAAALKKALGGKTLEDVMHNINSAKAEGRELDETAIQALEKQIDLLKDLDAAEASLNKQKDTAQKEVDKEMVNTAMERAGMGRSERVKAMRDKNDMDRQKNKAERDVARKLMREPNEALQKELDKRALNRKVGGSDLRKELAREEARRLVKNQFPDPAQSLDLIRKRLDALAAA